jgi:hypothetical protein
MLTGMTDVTRILSQIEQGDPQAAEQLLPLVYDLLRKLAAARAPRGLAKELIFTDKALGAKHQRPGLVTCLDSFKAAIIFSYGGSIGWDGPCGTS